MRGRDKFNFNVIKFLICSNRNRVPGYVKPYKKKKIQNISPGTDGIPENTFSLDIR